MLLRLFFFFIYFCCFACKKHEDRTCFKTIGNYSSKEIELADFDTLHVFGKIEYIIVQDTINKAIVSAGENMINQVKFSNNGKGKLIIENINNCSFLRSYQKDSIKVLIHYKKINNLIYSGVLSLTNLDTIKQKQFILESWLGSGKINLTVNNYFLVTSFHSGSADLYLSGKSVFHNLYSAGSSFAYEKNYEVDYYRINHSGTGNYYLGKFKNAELYMKNVGDIFYTGEPVFVTKNIVGSGKLIQETN